LSDYTNSNIINDEKVAVEVASAILKAVYGDVFGELPLLIKSDETEWFIKGELPENTEGGVPYISLKKSNSEVISIWADK
jgi:hypothetical protein